MGEGSRPTTKEVLRNFAENTSAHGIKKVTDNNGKVIKLAWILLLLGATGMIIFQVANLIKLYLSFPVITTTTIESKPMKFPSVTICNLNPIQNSLAKRDDIYNTVQKIADFLKIPIEDFDYSSDKELPDNYTFPEVDFNTDDPLDESLLEFQMLLQGLPRDELAGLSQNFSKFVVSCQFGGIDCKESEFSKTFDSDYGPCYTFPNKNNTPAGTTVYNSGPLFGLKLVLNVEQREYIPFITSSAGVRIQVHEFGSKPHLLELGKSLSTGFETQLGVSPILFERKGGLYGTCDDSGKYESALDCERDCLEDYIEKNCTCTRRLLPDEGRGGELNPCEAMHVSCVRSVIKRKQEGAVPCNSCQSTCRIYTYEEQMSMTRWPARHYDPAVLFKMKKWSSLSDGTVYDESARRDNMLVVNVYYSGLSLQTIREEPAYPWENLLSDIGGQLGLWLGISILSICEGFELVYLLVRNCCKPRTSSKVTNVR